MDRLIAVLVSIYIFLSCVPYLLIITTENTVLPFFAMLIVLLWGYYYLVSGRIRFARMDLYLGLFVISFLMSVCLNPAVPRDDWISLGANIQLACIFVVTRTMLTDRRRIQFVLGILLVGLCLLAILTILDGFDFISLETEAFTTESGTRHGSLAGGINRSTIYFGAATLLACGLLLEGKSLLIKVLLWGVIFLSLGANFLTYSVSGMVSLVVGFIILFSTRMPMKNILFKRTALVLLGLAFLISLFAYNPRMEEKYDQIRDQEFVYWGSTRGGTYLGALKAISQHPLLGAGPTQFHQEIFYYFPFYNPDKTRAAHNTFLAVAGECGLIGLFFFMLFLITVIAPLWRHRQKYQLYSYPGLLACLGMGLVMVFSLDLQRDKLFWIIIALSAATLNLSPPAEKTARRRI